MEFGDNLEDAEIVYTYTENQKKINDYADIIDADIDPLVRLSDALIYLNNNGFQIEIGEKSHTLFVTKDKYLIPICNVAVIKEIFNMKRKLGIDIHSVIDHEFQKI